MFNVINCLIDIWYIDIINFTGINELLSLSKKVECKRNLEGECERGTVVMDDWMNKTLAFQRRLAENVSLSQQQIIGSHNSFNDRAEG